MRITTDEKLRAIRPITADFPPEAREFLQDRAHLYTLTTMRNYAYDLRTFLQWLVSRLQHPPNWEADVNFRLIREFFRHLAGYDSLDRFGHAVRRSNSRKGFARKLATLSSLFEYLVAMGYLRENPIGSRERRRQILGKIANSSAAQELPVYLSREESARLLGAVSAYDRRRDHGASRERDNAILAMLLFTGLRVSELVGLDRRNLEWDRVGDSEYRAVLRVLGKGEKTRLVPMHPAVERILNTYLALRPKELPPESEEVLFLNRWRRRLSAKAVWEMVAKYTAEARLPVKEKAISPHKLRHTFATQLLQEGVVSLRELQELLGHASINTTTIYTHVANEQLRKAIDQHPLGEVLTGDLPATAGPATGKRTKRQGPVR